MSRVKIGVFVPRFKWDRLNLDSIKPESHGVELLEFDLLHDFDNIEEKLSSVDGIIHKFTYQLSEINDKSEGHSKEIEAIEKINEFSKRNSSFVVLEPIDNIRVFTGRDKLQESIHRLDIPDIFCYIDGYHVDDDFNVEKHGLKFPLILKAVVACGTKESHSMIIVNNEEQLKSRPRDVRFMAFPFVHHYGTVFKCYALNEDVYFRASSSLKINTSDSVVFDSQKKLPDEISNSDFDPNSVTLSAIYPKHEEIKEVANFLIRATRVHLIGFDIIRREGDNKLCLVDVNYFPCFRGIDDIPGKICSFIKSRAGV